MDEGIVFAMWDGIVPTFGRGDYGAWVGLIDATGFAGFLATDTMLAKTWTEFSGYELEDCTNAGRKATERAGHKNAASGLNSGEGTSWVIEKGEALSHTDQVARFRFTAAGSIAGFFVNGNRTDTNTGGFKKGLTTGYLIAAAELSLAFEIGDLLTIRYWTRFKMAGVTY